MIPHPNKTFVADFIHENEFGKVKYVIILAAKDKKTAEQHLLNLFGIKPSLTWLMNTNSLTIYDQVGKPLPVQAKILYNTHAKID